MSSQYGSYQTHTQQKLGDFPFVFANRHASFRGLHELCGMVDTPSTSFRGGLEMRPKTLCHRLNSRFTWVGNSKVGDTVVIIRSDGEKRLALESPIRLSSLIFLPFFNP